jgi:hypothetical protein
MIAGQIPSLDEESAGTPSVPVDNGMPRRGGTL